MKANILNNFTVKELQAAPPQELQNKLKISTKRADGLAFCFGEKIVHKKSVKSVLSVLICDSRRKRLKLWREINKKLLLKTSD